MIECEFCGGLGGTHRPLCARPRTAPPPAASEGTGDREALTALICTCGMERDHSSSCRSRIDRVLAAGFRRPVTGSSYGDECTEPKCWASDTRHYHQGSADKIGVLPGEPARPVTAGLTEAVQRVVDRMRDREVDHRHEDETGHMGVQGRAYFYAGDIYDDYEDLRAALATAVPTPGQESEAPPCSAHFEVQHRDGKPPWCNTCGWKRAVPAQPAQHLGAEVAPGGETE